MAACREAFAHVEKAQFLATAPRRRLVFQNEQPHRCPPAPVDADPGYPQGPIQLVTAVHVNGSPGNNRSCSRLENGDDASLAKSANGTSDTACVVQHGRIRNVGRHLTVGQTNRVDPEPRARDRNAAPTAFGRELLEGSDECIGIRQRLPGRARPNV